MSDPIWLLAVFGCVLVIVPILVDFIYTAICWLPVNRPHRFRRYAHILWWLGFDAATVTVATILLIKAMAHV